MKTLLRVLIILVVASIIGGLMYVAVNASGSTSTPSFEEGRPSGNSARMEMGNMKNGASAADLVSPVVSSRRLC
jgi:hypothetical protein